MNNYDLPINFSCNMYKKLNSDLKNLNDIELIKHYFTNGIKENRIYKLDLPNDFNVNMYKELNSDINYMDDVELMIHYFTNGIKENRIYKLDLPNDFDVNIYRKLNSDINYMDDNELMIHYFNNGMKENRIYKLDLPNDFDVNIYRKLNNDLSYMNDQELMIHYFTNGIKENKMYKNIYDNLTDKKLDICNNLTNKNLNINYNKIPNDFNKQMYKNIYDDLNNLTDKELEIHYLKHGINENRLYKLPDDFNFTEYKKLNIDLNNLSNKEIEIQYLKYGINEKRIYKCNKKNNIITIILPTLNRLNKFKKTIYSIINQTYHNFELIIIDDGSSKEICDDKELFINNINDNRIYFYKNKNNLKIPKTLNKGLEISKGDYLTWISDDNEYYNNFLENLYYPTFDYIYSAWDFQIIFNNIPQSEKIKKYTNYNNIKELLRDESGIWDGNASFMWRTSFLKEIYAWNEKYHGIEDYEIMFKTYLYTRSIKKIETVGMCYYDWKDADINNNITDQNGLTATIGLLTQNAKDYIEFKNYYYNSIYRDGIVLNNSEYSFPENIPKIAFTFWYGIEFTYLHYLSIETFCFYNRYFEYIIYTINNCTNHKWASHEQEFNIKCENYFYKIYILQNIYNIKIIYLDDKIYENYCPNIISDLIRWNKLYEHGGIWVDLDILFLKPIEFIFKDILKNCDFKKIDFIISNYKDVNGFTGHTDMFPTGLLIGSKNNLICKELIKIMYDSYNSKDYNSVGPNLAKNIFKSVEYFLNKFKNVGIFDPFLLYPFVWYEVSNYFFNYNIVQNNTVGLHWYNGHNTSRIYLNYIHKLIDNNKSFFKNNKSRIELYILQFLKVKSNAQKSYIICLVIDSYGWALNIMANTIKKILGDDHLIYIYTTQELIDNILDDSFDVKIIDLFLLLNSYDINLILNKPTLVSLIPTDKTVHWICDYSSWINHPDEEILLSGRNMLLDTYNNSTITLVSCDKIKKYLKDINVHPKNLFEFEYMVNLEIFKFYEYNNNILTKNKINIGWAGNASPHCHGWLKGLDNIKSVINKNNDKFNLIYHNKFEGNDLKYEEKPEFYKKIDIYICFSKYEGSPNTILEASSCGRAWISTDVGNVNKMINLNNNCGIIINRTEEDLEKLLLELYENRNKIIELGLNARKTIEEHFNYKIIIKNIFKDIFKILNF